MRSVPYSCHGSAWGMAIDESMDNWAYLKAIHPHTQVMHKRTCSLQPCNNAVMPPRTTTASPPLELTSKSNSKQQCEGKLLSCRPSIRTASLKACACQENSIISSASRHEAGLLLHTAASSSGCAHLSTHVLHACFPQM